LVPVPLRVATMPSTWPKAASLPPTPAPATAAALAGAFAREAARARAALRPREDGVLARLRGSLAWTTTGLSTVAAADEAAVDDCAATPSVPTIKTIELTAPMSRQRPIPNAPTTTPPFGGCMNAAETRSYRSGPMLGTGSAPVWRFTISRLEKCCNHERNDATVGRLSFQRFVTAGCTGMYECTYSRLAQFFAIRGKSGPAHAKATRTGRRLPLKAAP